MENTKITYIGHAATLIETPAGNVLTDPNFSPRVLFYRRIGELKYDPAKLPKLSAVLISHVHIDHLDYASFNYIKTDVPIVVPEGSAKRISNYLPNPVIELGHWANHEIGGLKIHAVPAKHKSNLRCPYFYKNASGYVIDTGSGVIYFAGDSAYGTHFHDIGSAHSIDTALLPIGSYKPPFLVRNHHMNPREAVQAFIDLKAGVMIPIHWGVFRLTLENPAEPIEWLTKIIAERELEDKIKIIPLGGTYDI